ncbi:MAG: hypothetical protein WC471_03190 [Candidatus Woesearchaeota archaeon]
MSLNHILDSKVYDLLKPKLGELFCMIPHETEIIKKIIITWWIRSIAMAIMLFNLKRGKRYPLGDWYFPIVHDGVSKDRSFVEGRLKNLMFGGYGGEFTHEDAAEALKSIEGELPLQLFDGWSIVRHKGKPHLYHAK